MGMTLSELHAYLFPEEPTLPGSDRLRMSDVPVWQQRHNIRGGMAEVQEHYRRTLLYGADYNPTVDLSDGRELCFADIVELTADKPGETRIVCPECHPEHYQSEEENSQRGLVTKRSLVVTRRRFDLASFRCVYCGYQGTVQLEEPPEPEVADAWKAWHARVKEEERAEKTADAMTIWRESVPIKGTLAEAYLRRRGITELPPHIDDVLRFHRRCRFGLFEVEAMVALCCDPRSGEPRGIHRTKLPVGGWRRGVAVERMELGPQGAIRLWPRDGNRLVVGEGIETVLSAAQSFRDPTTGEPLHPAWAFGTAGNLERHCVRLRDIERLVILSDNDKNLRGQEAAENVKEAWELRGCNDVTTLTPPEAGTDFNDLLLDQLEAAR